LSGFILLYLECATSECLCSDEYRSSALIDDITHAITTLSWFERDKEFASHIFYESFCSIFALSCGIVGSIDGSLSRTSECDSSCCDICRPEWLSSLCAIVFSSSDCWFWEDCFTRSIELCRRIWTRCLRLRPPSTSSEEYET
jgi:hypothetical protein